MFRKLGSDFAWVLIGILLAILVALLGIGAIWGYHGFLTKLGRSLDIPIAAILPTSIPDAHVYLEKSHMAIDSGHPERIHDVLFPAVKSFADPKDQIAAYRLLGDAEVAQGGYQLAGVYFEYLYEVEKTPENLMLIAVTYDMGGDLARALHFYKILAGISEPGAEIYQHIVRKRIDEITAVYEAINLGATLTPEPTNDSLPLER